MSVGINNKFCIKCGSPHNDNYYCNDPECRGFIEEKEGSEQLTKITDRCSITGKINLLKKLLKNLL